MNENAKKWVEALRSGKYKQVRGTLHRGDGFCCLGVACDLYREETGKGEWGKSEVGGVAWFQVAMEQESSYLPDEVMRWLDLRSYVGDFDEPVEGDIEGDGADSLTLMNDEGASFEKIASVIEMEPEGMFGFERVLIVLSAGEE